MNIYEVIVKPVITEKSAKGEEHLTYTLLVHPDANKIDVARAIKDLYNAQVATVRMVRIHEKTRMTGKGRSLVKRSAGKRAIITLKKGEKAIDFVKTKKSK